MKKRLAVILSVLLIVCLAVCTVFVLGGFKYDTGVVTKITVNEINRDNLELKMTYFYPMGGYSVRNVAEEEGEYCGDGMKEYDGSLGKYRIIVEFGDALPHDSFAKNLLDGQDFKPNNSNVKLKLKIAYPSDHGFVLYIGSDNPIHVEDIKGKKLSGLGGTVKIPISVGDSNIVGGIKV